MIDDETYENLTAKMEQIIDSYEHSITPENFTFAMGVMYGLRLALAIVKDVFER